MKRATITAAVLVALAAPGPANAVSHVSLSVPPAAAGVGGGWRLYVTVPAREFLGGEIIGVTLQRTSNRARARESHDLRGAALDRSTIVFDGQRGTWRVTDELGSSLGVNMTIAATGARRALSEYRLCRGAWREVPVALRGRFAVRTGTTFFKTVRRTQLRGTIVFNEGGPVVCSPAPLAGCTPWTRLVVSRDTHNLTASRDDGGYLGVSFRQPVRGGAWYHRIVLTGLQPLAGALPSLTLRIPPGLPLSGGGTFAAGETTESTRGACGVTGTAGVFSGSIRARFTGWRPRMLTLRPTDFAAYEQAREL